MIERIIMIHENVRRLENERHYFVSYVHFILFKWSAVADNPSWSNAKLAVYVHHPYQMRSAACGIRYRRRGASANDLDDLVSLWKIYGGYWNIRTMRQLIPATKIVRGEHLLFREKRRVREFSLQFYFKIYEWFYMWINDT